MSEATVNPANPILCPNCGQTLNALQTQTDVTCACGFTAFAPYVIEANYLRTGLPKWQARLTELEDAINQGLRPEASSASALGSSAKSSAGAYQYLVGSGSILLFAGLAAFVGIMWRYLGTGGQGTVLVLVTAVLAVLANRLSSRIQSTATALSVLTVGSWLIDAGWVISHVFKDLNPTSRIVTTLLIPTLLAIITALVFIYLGKRFANSTWSIVGQVFIPVSVGLTLTSIALNIQISTELTSILLAALALPLTVAILVLYVNGSAVQSVFTSLSRTLSVVFSSVFAFGFVVASIQTQDNRAPLAWSIHLVVLSIFALSQPTIRGIAPALIAGACALSAGFTDLPTSARVLFPAVLGLLSLRVNKESKFPVALLVAATSGIWIFLALAINSVPEQRLYVAGLSLFTGLVLTAHAQFSKRSEYVPLGSAFMALAVIFTNIHLEVTRLEAFTLPIALVFLVSGLLAHRINSTLSSLLWLGPSCAAAIVPSALRASETLTYSLRFSVSLVAALILLILGARLRYLGMLAVGLITIIILARTPLISLFNAVQPWISFTLSGVLLLVIGARFEYLRKRAGVAKEWITGSLR